MKYLTIIAFLIGIAACESKNKINYRWDIHGWVDYRGEKHPAIWRVDTFQMINDTIVITNSDSSKWRVAPPYTIKPINR